MTDIGVFSLPYQIEDRSWLLTASLEHIYTLGVTIQVSSFSATAHYPNGYIPSGTVLGVITASSTNGALVVGPYDPNATDGRQTAAGILFASVRVWNPLGVALTKVGGAMLVAWGVVSQAKLPFSPTNSSGASRTVADGATNSNTTVTSATAAFTGADVGASISGGSIPAGATIVSVTNATTVVISAAATTTATGVSITIADRAGGFLNSAAQTALNHLHFVA